MSNFIFENNSNLNQIEDFTSPLLQMIINIILIPVYEEILYRGIIFGYMKNNFNIAISVILQALIWGVMHLNLVQGIYTFILGIVLALIYIYAESILGSIIVNLIFNWLSMMILPNLILSVPEISIFLLGIVIICTTFSFVKIVKQCNENYRDI
ncbi:CPBP family intramembrane glutamic endopeptidase [Paraclostridium sordellii]|uniref:CPBP family intramembrane glutamic endopeptidase n=1 Tax=Paraclostridium sordellii TaxID=1505 RepID=UPI0018FE69C2|nr:CPBP family intramembrane glutamic endopeptidase [Paeniclostridium sordellii]